MNTKIYTILIILLMFSVPNFCYSNEDPITVSCYSDKIIDCDLFYKEDNVQYKLWYVTDIDGNAEIQYHKEINFSSFNDLKPILTKLIKRAASLNKDKIDTFVTFEYMNSDDIAKKGVLAFINNKEWKKYISDSKSAEIAPPYNCVKETLIKNNVYSQLQEMFRSCGYECVLGHIEYIFQYKAKDFTFYNDLKKIGVLSDDIFPVPGMLFFEINKINKKIKVNKMLYPTGR